jgi:hypothetical protein
VYEPVPLPSHERKMYPPLAIAFIATAAPLLYQLLPGVMDPPAPGDAVSVR